MNHMDRMCMAAGHCLCGHCADRFKLSPASRVLFDQMVKEARERSDRERSGQKLR